MNNTLPLSPLLLEMYSILDSHYGDLCWWPADSPWEVVVGAILTQNTAWKNVEKVIINLKKANFLSEPRQLHQAATELIEEQIKPCGYYRQKALKLKIFAAFMQEQYKGNWATFAKSASKELRNTLLSLWGIGKETADSILLYALDVPIFVVDAYTKRVLYRHGLCGDKASYDVLQQIFHSALDNNTALFKQFHALFVNVGKDFCKKSLPNCNSCPLANFMKKPDDFFASGNNHLASNRSDKTKITQNVSRET